LIEDIAQTLPLDNMIANAQLLADENHSDAHDVSETRHQHSLNGLKPGPHTCHKQNLLQRHRLVGRGIELPCQFPLTGGKRCHCNFKTAPVVTQNHTTSFANGKPHPTFDCCVGDNSAGWQWYHSSAQWCHRMLSSSAPPLLGFTSI